MESHLQPTGPAVDPNASIINSSKLSKIDIQRLISQNSERITFQKKSSTSRTKSKVWCGFEIIFVDGAKVDFVSCVNCKDTFAWTNTLGTSHLKRHASCCNDTKGSKITSNCSKLKIDSCFIRTISKDVLNALNDEIVIGLAKDLRPLSSVDKEGFRHIAQRLVDFGAKFGSVNITSILKHRTTLKEENLPRLAATKKEEIMKKICAAPQKPNYAFTTDMWSDKYKQRNFLSFTIHYIDESWKLRSQMLSVHEFPEDKKTIENIREECKKLLMLYFDQDETQTVFENSWLVTDGGSNLKNVFPQQQPCLCHKLNLMIHWTFNDKALDSKKIEEAEHKGKPYPPKKLFVLTEQCPKIKDTMSGVKELVAYFKKSGLNSKLQYSLKQDVVTRWNSELIMLESYLKSAKDVQQILIDNSQVHRLTKIDDKTVQELVEFLKPFMECSTAFSKEKRPTLQIVAPWFHRLRNHIKEAGTDSEEIKALKIQARSCFEEYCYTSKMHHISCFLNPRYRKLKFIEESLRQTAYEEIQRLMTVEYDKFGVNVTQMIVSESTSTSGENSESLKPKRRKFADLEDSDDEFQEETDSVTRAAQEFKQYMQLKLLDDSKKGLFDVLEFWSSASHLPALSKIAQRILAIPASQASDERAFSTTGLTLTPRRTELSSETLSLLTFVHSHF